MKFSNRKKLAMIMTLTSFLGGKSSAANKSKNVGGAVNSNSESSFNNQSKLDTKNINNGNIINNKSLDNSSKKLNERVMNVILAAGGAGATGLVALIYHGAELLFGNRNKVDPFFDVLSRSKQFAIKLLKNRDVASFTIDKRGGLKFSDSNDAQICLDGDYVKNAKLVNPGVNGKELLDSALLACNATLFYYAYESYLNCNIMKIALKHGLNFILDEKISKLVKNFYECNINITVEFKNNGLSIKILDRSTKQDITQEYNNDNPTTDLDKQKKGFYDDLVKFINNDDFVRKIFFDSRNEVNPVVDPFLDNMSRSGQFTTKLLKNIGATSFLLDSSGFIYFYSPVKQDGIVDERNRIVISNVVKTAKWMNPGISGEKLLAVSSDIDKFWRLFYSFYQTYFRLNVSKIALKHDLNFLVDEDILGLVENSTKCLIDLMRVEFKNKKILVKIFNNKGRDITQEYNKDNPETDLDNRKKGFYNDLVKFINDDDFLRKIFLE